MVKDPSTENIKRSTIQQTGGCFLFWADHGVVQKWYTAINPQLIGSLPPRNCHFGGYHHLWTKLPMNSSSCRELHAAATPIRNTLRWKVRRNGKWPERRCAVVRRWVTVHGHGGTPKTFIQWLSSWMANRYHHWHTHMVFAKAFGDNYWWIVT